jgi:protein-disulfide isomerase
MEEPKNVLTVPVAIIVAGALIAGAVLYTKKPTAGPQVANLQETTAELPPITAEDHILGNPDAPVKIVEYSDTSCPFCKRFHPTMKQIMTEYGKDGRVAWVYRHYPIPQLHPNAPREAEALECAGELGGNTKFWDYTHRLYDVTAATAQGLSDTQLVDIAKYVGVDTAKFEGCLNSGKHAERVQKDFSGGAAAGVLGTPFSFVVTNDGKKVPIEGAYSYTEVKKIIDTILTSEE